MSQALQYVRIKEAIIIAFYTPTVTEDTTSPSKGSRLANLFGKSGKSEEKDNSEPSLEQNHAVTSPTPEPNTLEQGLEKSRKGLFAKIGHAFKGSFDLDDELFEELEDALISSDVGIESSLKLIEQLRTRIQKDKLQTAKEVIHGLRLECASLLQSAEQVWQFDSKPHVILVVGVNGVGKTTTTAKIAQRLVQQGNSVMLAAADTFRAAAVEQLQDWGQRLQIPVIAQKNSSDAAAVAHDALISARAKGTDVLLIDTAGRLHTQTNLMEQLQKVTRVLQKIDPQAPQEVMQILDAGTGQNALTQLQHFQQAVNVSSVCLTKLDGSAKGGVVLPLSDQFKLPIRFVGIGERAEDLKPFSASDFATSLIPDISSAEQ